VILSIRSDSFRHTRKVCNAAFSALSPVALAVMFGIAVAWTLERAPSQTFVSTENRMVVQAGSDLGVSAPSLILHLETQKAIYRLHIEDNDGNIVYQFPDQVVRNPASFSLNNAHYLVPRDLKPGAYVLQLKVIYPFNPFKNGEISVTSFLTVQ
jgi:hypothetical protein